jgi:hypothetical protein
MKSDTKRCVSCNKKIICKCSVECNVKTKYKTCWCENPHKEIYPQAFLDFKGVEHHICSLRCSHNYNNMNHNSISNMLNIKLTNDKSIDTTHYPNRQIFYDGSTQFDRNGEECFCPSSKECTCC